MPEPGLDYRTVRRVAGVGSLGHVRVVAIAECHGGRIAREAKALAPSAIHWASGKKGPGEIAYQTILDRAVRDPDPFVELRGSWILRRLSPHCSRIELAVLPSNRDEIRLLFSMGWETANIHLGTRGARRSIGRHLDRLKPVELLSAAKDMAKAVTKDWRAWKEAEVNFSESWTTQVEAFYADRQQHSPTLRNERHCCIRAAMPASVRPE